MITAQVLNGTVKIGDTIAYSVKTGAIHDMNIATVRDIRNKSHDWKDEIVQVLKVKVTKSSGYADVPRTVTVSVLDRVVKL
jgi:hypothetical protein